MAEASTATRPADALDEVVAALPGSHLAVIASDLGSRLGRSVTNLGNDLGGIATNVRSATDVIVATDGGNANSMGGR